MPDGASENKVRSTRNSGDAYGYSMYRKLLPKFLDMIDMSLLDDESKASRHGWKEHQKVPIRQKSAQTTVSIKHCILTEKVFVR